jgi:hypothetical protein
MLVINRLTIAAEAAPTKNAEPDENRVHDCQAVITLAGILSQQMPHGIKLDQIPEAANTIP